MDSNTKKNVQLAFEKLKLAYDRLTIADAKAYYITLGNVNEVHLVRKDGRKDVFLGRLFSDATSSFETELTTIWTVLKKYFESTVVAPATEEKPVEEVKPVKKTTTKKKKEEPVTKEVATEVVTEVVTDMPSDVEVSEEDDAEFDSWTDKMSIL